MSKTFQIGLIQGGQKNGYVHPKLFPFAVQRYFTEKSKNKETTQICLKYNLSTSVLSTLMTHVKNISNWPDPGGQKWDMSPNYSLSPYKGNFPGKTKNNRST